MPEGRKPALTRAELTGAIRRKAVVEDWSAAPTAGAENGSPGFPDLVLVCVEEGRRRVLFRTVKPRNGRLTADESLWLELLRAAGADAGTWRETDLADGTVERDLRRRTRRRGRRKVRSVLDDQIEAENGISRNADGTCA